MTIRVMIVDDHEIFRQGVRSVLEDEEDITVVSEAGNARDARDLARSSAPDVITVDIRLGATDGIELVRKLKSVDNPPACVILSTYEDREYLVGALAAQADAYLLKSNSYETLADAIRTVHRNGRTLSEELISTMMEEYSRFADQQVRQDSGLNPKDVEMLRILAEGGRTSDIADQLHMTEVTVKRRIQDVCMKLHANNRVQAVAEAIRRGLI
ncbi:response regulator transcription factor [Pelagovum pacificum]|uniref:Response regulator transcription factor n=2 Tax=Pelagovum pacificum TaxID=2588711 RepID=A0A5C5GDF2_9RHOB|nr:response regulator transcription factor [Pelagovum pacificum]TNY32194.1 response regulator transcription factor [Pelagovum pacificum]